MNDAARFETSPMTPVVLTKAICLFAGLQMLIRGIRQRSIKSNVSSANKPTLSEGTWRKMTICTSATLSNTPTQSSSEIVLKFVSHSPPPPPLPPHRKRTKNAFTPFFQANHGIPPWNQLFQDKSKDESQLKLVCPALCRYKSLCSHDLINILKLFMNAPLNLIFPPPRTTQVILFSPSRIFVAKLNQQDGGGERWGLTILFDSRHQLSSCFEMG